MHELSIAMELVELASAEAHRLGDARVVSVRMRLGPLAGVVEDALRFSFEVACAGTPLEGARLEVEREPIVGWCNVCQRNQPLPAAHLRNCPDCVVPICHLVSGTALELTALEIVDDAAPNR